MTRKEEQDILMSLKGDTYFSKFFGENDINKMIENIGNDFPIELECQFMERENETILRNKELREQIKEVKSDILYALVDCGDTTSKTLRSVFGTKKVIEVKRDLDKQLDKEEIDWLCKQVFNAE